RVAVRQSDFNAGLYSAGLRSPVHFFFFAASFWRVRQSCERARLCHPPSLNDLDSETFFEAFHQTPSDSRSSAHDHPEGRKIYVLPFGETQNLVPNGGHRAGECRALRGHQLAEGFCLEKAARHYEI